MAKMAVTIDDISGAACAGPRLRDPEGEHLTFGFPHQQRVGRFEEALQITRTCSTASRPISRVTHRLRGARLLPMA
jgi:hypothetical protein